MELRPGPAQVALLVGQAGPQQLAGGPLGPGLGAGVGRLLPVPADEPGGQPLDPLAVPGGRAAQRDRLAPQPVGLGAVGGQLLPLGVALAAERGPGLGQLPLPVGDLLGAGVEQLAELGGLGPQGVAGRRLERLGDHDQFEQARPDLHLVAVDQRALGLRGAVDERVVDAGRVGGRHDRWPPSPLW